MDYAFELVGKIGSMAMIRQEDNDIDYNVLARISQDLHPGIIWVSSGATEIGRLDYIHRTGMELTGPADEVKTDYASQGQSILMETYRRFVRPEYSIRQILVEHTHFNDPEKREHIRALLVRSAMQGAIPIINYNDPVSAEENRKMELMNLRRRQKNIVECVDNDETAAVIASLVHARRMVLLTTTDGIYQDPKDPSTLVRNVTARTAEELTEKVRILQANCVGASRAGANGAGAKLEYSLRCALQGTEVIIGHCRHHLNDLVNDKVPCTRVTLI